MTKTKHHRRSIRLPEYNYSRPAGYFITVCARDRECLFGQITDGKMNLNQYGQIVRDEWLRTANIRSNVKLDEFMVMPVWQRNYYEHVIRQGIELDEKRKYIIKNPFNWDTDLENISGNKPIAVGNNNPKP